MIDINVQEMKDSCLRVTGHTVEDWNVEFSTRRAKGFQTGALGYGRIYTDSQAENMGRHYGFMADDWETTEAPRNEIVTFTQREDKIMDAVRMGHRSLILERKGKIQKVEIASMPESFMRYRLREPS